jgi:hypothetical protein
MRAPPNESDPLPLPKICQRLRRDGWLAVRTLDQRYHQVTRRGAVRPSPSNGRLLHHLGDAASASPLVALERKPEIIWKSTQALKLTSLQYVSNPAQKK